MNEHNGWVPRDFWLADWEKQAIIGFHLKNPLEGYWRLTFMMMDSDIVAVSRSSVWRVLSQAGLLSKWNGKLSKKGTGFGQPLAAHQHWVFYLNIQHFFGEAPERRPWAVKREDRPATFAGRSFLPFHGS